MVTVHLLDLSGGTVSVVMDISSPLAVSISAAVAIVYTLMGGLYSVAYTDVIQLSLMLLGLVQTSFPELLKMVFFALAGALYCPTQKLQ